VALTLVAAAGGALLARAVRLPGGVLLGALLAAASVQMLVEPGPLPSWLRLVAQLAIGAVLGARLHAGSLRDVRRWAGPFAIALVAVLAAAAAGAALLVTTTGMAWSVALLSVLPGGAADAVALALVAGEAAAPTVAGIHLTRQVLVLVVVGGGLRWWARRSPSQDRPPRGVPRPTAGAVLWRRMDDELLVALVHRPRYDDWSLPKGGIDPGETAAQAAVRESFEETGWDGIAGPELTTVRLRERRGPTGHKRVAFLAVEARENRGFAPTAEVDEVRWLPLAEAAAACSRPQDRAVLVRFAEVMTSPLDERRRRARVRRRAVEPPEPRRGRSGRGRL
jgi:membrane AbrB-like protein